MRKLNFQLLFIIFSLISYYTSGQSVNFDPKIISETVALHPLIFDVNGDGKNDIVVVDNYTDNKGDDAVNLKSLCWYSYPELKRTTIAELNYRACHIAEADIDNDGFADIVGRYDTDGDDMNETGAIFWLKNPYSIKNNPKKEWIKTDMGFSTYAKDFCTADFNKDGKMDVAVRSVNHAILLFYQQPGNKWISRSIEVPAHDGTDIGDIDADGDMDIVINGIWFENPSDINGFWKKHVFAPKWFTQKTGKTGAWFDNNCKVVVSDMDGDELPDVIISNAENTGYPVCWYKNPGYDTLNTRWTEYPIGFMNYCHTLRIADFDNDGDKDVICGQLSPWNDRNPDGPHQVVLFQNKGNSLDWDKQLISEHGCYGGSIGDIDSDGDIDFIAPKNYNKKPLTLWINKTDQKVSLKSIKIEDAETDGMNCFKIITPSATYIYDKEGGGFVSMFDKSGNDWIGFKNTELPFPGDASTKYRGIPNLGIGGMDSDAGHPGFNQCISKIIAPNVIETVTRSGNWKWRWVFYSDKARFIMVQAPPTETYWFLYEGVPAGKYQPEEMYWGTSGDGKRTDIPDLLGETGAFDNWQWVYFGNRGIKRILFMKQQQPDELTDLFSYMGSSEGEASKSPDGMVCFGFGRAHHTKPILTGSDITFTIGFIEMEITDINSQIAINNQLNSPDL